MEEGSEQVVAGGAGGSVSVSLHPLVVMNVSDHFTRVKVQNEVPASNVSGLLCHFTCNSDTKVGFSARY